jgi:hypothetical protein
MMHKAIYRFGVWSVLTKLRRDAIGNKKQKVLADFQLRGKLLNHVIRAGRATIMLDIVEVLRRDRDISLLALNACSELLLTQTLSFSVFAYHVA